MLEKILLTSQNELEICSLAIARLEAALAATTCEHLKAEINFSLLEWELLLACEQRKLVKFEKQLAARSRNSSRQEVQASC